MVIIIMYWYHTPSLNNVNTVKDYISYEINNQETDNWVNRVNDEFFWLGLAYM
jgi:hypothetical protein